MNRRNLLVANMPQAFTAALAPLIQQKSRLAIAVSGGADSFALLHMASQWAVEHDVELVALTVDHQLRPESVTEAALVADWCRKHGILHQTLPWQGEKPVTGIQAAARQARKDLLGKACKRLAIDAVLLGHQADDQAETMIMRLQRGSGLDGLEAMLPVAYDASTEIDFIRPLLAFKRTRLRQYCIDHALPFIDDPSNNDRFYERVRVRETLASLPQIAEGAAKTALRLRRANDTLNRLAQDWLDAHSFAPQSGQFWLPATWRVDLLPEIQLRVLHNLLNTIKRQRLSIDKLEKLAGQMNAPAFNGSNIAGCWVRPKVMNKNPGFLFSAEPPRKA